MSQKLDAEKITDFLKTCKGFDQVLQKVKIISLGDGKCTAELTVDDSCLNVLKGLHGGFSATIIDSVSSFALMSQTGVPGVSTDLHVSYLKSVKLGDTIIVNARVIKSGKTLAFLEAEILNKATGEVAVKGSHTKFVAQ